MATRIKKHLVTFDHSFRLDDIEVELPAGRYTIETEEELLDDPSFLAARWIATTLIARPPPSSFAQTRYWSIAPDGLAAALERDAEQTAELAIKENLKSEPPHE